MLGGCSEWLAPLPYFVSQRPLDFGYEGCYDSRHDFDESSLNERQRQGERGGGAAQLSAHPHPRHWLKEATLHSQLQLNGRVAREESGTALAAPRATCWGRAREVVLLLARLLLRWAVGRSQFQHEAALEVLIADLMDSRAAVGIDSHGRRRRGQQIGHKRKGRRRERLRERVAGRHWWHEGRREGLGRGEEEKTHEGGG